MRKIVSQGMIVLLVAVTGYIFGQDGRTIEFPTISVGQIKSVGFKLNSSRNLQLDVTGAGIEGLKTKHTNMMLDPNGMFVYAWIIDAQTRELTWQMTVDNTKKAREGLYNREFRGQLKLPAGQYEIYFSARKPSKYPLGDGFFSLGKFLEKLLRGKENEWEANEKDWHLILRGVDEVINSYDLEKFHNILKKQFIVNIAAQDDGQFYQQGFSLDKQGLFSIYALGEAFDGDEFDYGWIVKADGMQKVWEMVYEQSAYAGGAVKNRVWRKKLLLEPGNYWVYYVTDDSHSPAHWNANPPYDPVFWGISIAGVPGKFSPESVSQLQKSKIKPIVQLTRIGNDEDVNQIFSLKRKLRIRILALGEGRDGEMFDYGWIIDKRSGEKIWEMRYENTRHAGGTDKNRMVDEIIMLPPGTYEVYYHADDSHAYPRWNAAPPYNPTSWGITIFPAETDFSPEVVRHVSSEELSKDVLVKITRVYDDDHVRKVIKLDKESRIRIYAIGEGDWDEMFDYGWIESEESGEVVWRMDYDNTRWAGGARKNRKADTVITLPAGRYSVHFVTDGSHSYNHWNADPPNDPESYGITIFLVTN